MNVPLMFPVREVRPPNGLLDDAPALPRLLAGIREHGALSLDEHVAVHGPVTPLRGGRRRRGRDHAAALIDEVERAGLLGRGGAAFPTATKMRAVRAARGRPIVVANGCESEPVSVKDALLLHETPHLVLDGAALAARAVGADRVILAYEGPRSDTRISLEHALKQRRAARVDSVRFELFAAAEKFLTGQETALMAQINGGLPRPSFIPPRPTERGVRRRADVASVAGYYDTHAPAFVARDGDSSYFVVSLKATADKQVQETGADIADELSTHAGVVVGGFAVAHEQVNKQVENDLRMAELIAFPLLFLLSLLFFRSLVAAVLPLMIGGLAIVGTFLILRVASEFGGISIFALNLTTALGLGLAIDYSLFIVSRYREEIAKDGPGLPAMRRVLATSGRTVFFSSLTVSAALASLLVFPQSFLYSMGLGGALVALLAALISLTVLPASRIECSTSAPEIEQPSPMAV